MKTVFIAFIVLTTITSSSFATENVDNNNNNNKVNNFSIGWNISSFSNNYGLGIDIVSPRFLDGKLHVALSTDYAWVQGITLTNTTQTTWTPFTMLRLGIYSDHLFPNLPLRMYGGGGPLLLIASPSLASTATLGGGFGLVGLEFFLHPRNVHAMFLEFGGMGTGAAANKLVGKPVYANGFTISWGFRHFL